MSTTQIPPPVVMVQHIKFSYPDGTLIYKDLDFGIDLDSRIALVGPNGAGRPRQRMQSMLKRLAGKSTLMKLLCEELIPTDGLIRKHSHLRIARFHQARTAEARTSLTVALQHLADQLDYNLTPIEFMQSQFPEDFKDFEVARNAIGRFGVTGKMQVRAFWRQAHPRSPAFRPCR